MATKITTDDRLQRVYELLGELLEERADESATDTPAWYAPPLPPVAAGMNISATDLLSWWFRPPSRKRKAWDQYLGSGHTAAVPIPDKPQLAAKGNEATSPASDIVSEAIWQAMLPEPDDELASEEAESAVEVLYEFLRAFGRGDIEGALHWVSEDYHVIEDDCEIDRSGLRCRLEALLASLHGWEFEVCLAEVPQPLSHPYGIVIYAEIQIDAFKPEELAARSQSERRLVLLERVGEFDWKIAAMSRPRI
jgi:hypothetical protein